MQTEKFSLLRKILKVIGLSPAATEDIIERISDFLSEPDEKSSQPDEKSSESEEYPYFIRDAFLSPAEHSFYQVLQKAVGSWAIVLTKVSLSDLFYVRHTDPSRYRILTNKIDRKHVDFLLCDPLTVKPLAGIELDDKSHQRPDRQERDEFVEEVFEAAKLPLLRTAARHTYSVGELETWVKQGIGEPEDSAASKATTSPPAPEASQAIPNCPQCSAPMVLRTVKTGPNQGGKFWGCPNYPRCRGIVPFKP
jgi:hypothetical protein